MASCEFCGALYRMVQGEQLSEQETFPPHPDELLAMQIFSKEGIDDSGRI